MKEINGIQLENFKHEVSSFCNRVRSIHNQIENIHNDEQINNLKDFIMVFIFFFDKNRQVKISVNKLTNNLIEEVISSYSKTRE